MTGKKKTAPTSPVVNIENCSVQNGSVVNEHTRAAVEALALAAGKNADAIHAIARALEGAPATMENGFRIGIPNG